MTEESNKHIGSDFDEFMKELNADESKEIDQLTSYRFGKKISEHSETGKIPDSSQE